MSSSSDIKFTITRALAELKMLDKRILRKINEGVYVSQSTKNNRRKDDPVSKALPHFQSVNDLITFRNLLKSQVIESNATVFIKIGGKMYTVANAVERKGSIKYEKQLLAILKQQRLAATKLVERHNQQERLHLQELLKAHFGRENGKLDTDAAKAMEDSFWSNNKAALIDPLDISKRIESLENDIETFENEVDFVLSESNSQTYIDVSS